MRGAPPRRFQSRCSVPGAGGTHAFWVPAGANELVASYANEIMDAHSALGPEDEEQLIGKEHCKRAP